MSGVDGRAWIGSRFPAERVERLAAFLDMVVKENTVQNLIAPSTIGAIWERHALDSAQLLAFERPGTWIDVGTGGGFPGMVVAILREGPVTLVEPRGRRASFLSRCVDDLGLTHVHVVAGKVEQISTPPAAVISARAVATMPALLAAAKGCAGPDTRWILPRGRSGKDDLAALKNAWHGVFHVEHSVVDPDSVIVILDKVRSR